MADVDKLLEEFEEALNSKKLRDLMDVLFYKNGTYKAAEDVADAVGDELGAILRRYLSALPEGKISLEEARELLTPMLKKAHEAVSSAAYTAQANVNNKAGMRLEPITAEFDRDRARGLAKELSDQENVRQIEAAFEDQANLFCWNVVDETVRKNANAHYKAGLRPMIIRRSIGKCCEWCDKLVGKYDYWNVRDTGNDVFRRHNNCKCIVEYDPGSGERQNVWTKDWAEDADPDRIKNRIKQNNRSELRRLEPRRIIKLPTGDYTYGDRVRLSAGARSVNDYHATNPLTGEDIKLIPNERIIYPKDHLIAGKGTKKPIRKIEGLLKLGGRAEDWVHEKAYFKAYDEYGEEAYVELHWFECDGVLGKHDVDPKMRENEIFFYDINEWENRWKW